MTLWTHSSQEIYSQLLVPSSYLVLDSWKGHTHISIVSGTCSHLNPFDCWHGNIVQVLDFYVSSTFHKCDRRRFSWIQFFFWILIWWCHFLWSSQSTPYLNWSKSSENKQNFSHRQKKQFWRKVGLCHVSSSVAVNLDPGVCCISRRKIRWSEFLKPIFPKVGHPIQWPDICGKVIYFK